jgi:amino acid transporter
MSQSHDANRPEQADDVRTLESLGYSQELHRGMNAFSNFAISLSIICILAGGITSFHLGYCSVGGASVGIGWPLVCLFSLVVAATMGQVASAFPTAGGLYHWAAILGGRGWGWATAWFNLAGLITVLAAINVGCWQFLAGSFGPLFDFDAQKEPGRAQLLQVIGVSVITLTQAVFNHRGIRLTARLTDLSGSLILVLSVLLTIVLLASAKTWDFTRLVTFTNFSGYPLGAEAPVWPRTESLVLLFALGFLLPAYTLTGFDASAHTAEETIGAARNVPRGIVRSVIVSGLFGWVMLCALVLAIPDVEQAAQKGEGVFYWIMEVLPPWLRYSLLGGIGLVQYLCGLAALTSGSRMAFAFARDGGLPFSQAMRHVHPRFRVPVLSIWGVGLLALGFALFVPYAAITAVCIIFLYIGPSRWSACWGASACSSSAFSRPMRSRGSSSEGWSACCWWRGGAWNVGGFPARPRRRSPARPEHCDGVTATRAPDGG